VTDLMKCPWSKAERKALIGVGDQRLAEFIEAPLSPIQVSERWEATVRVAEARVAALETAATVALKWMDWWLNEDMCECEGIGHRCGWSERKAEADTLRAALNGSPGPDTGGE